MRAGIVWKPKEGTVMVLYDEDMEALSGYEDVGGTNGHMSEKELVEAKAKAKAVIEEAMKDEEYWKEEVARLWEEVVKKANAYKRRANEVNAWENATRHLEQAVSRREIAESRYSRLKVKS